MTYQAIRYSVESGIATLTLARPDKLNAFDATMLREALEVLDRVDADDDVRALVVTGEGRAFCSGADLSRGTETFVEPGTEDIQRADGSIDYLDERARDGGGLISLRMYDLLKPIIGAINGPAVGLGVTFMLPMDVRIASTAARFGFVFARRGMVPEAASGFFLPRLVGISRAVEWCAASRMVEPEEALASGLVRSVVAPGELLPTAYALAREIADNSAPVSVALARQMMWRGLGASHPMDAHRVDSRGIASRGRSRDVIEGVTAWMEKRRPDFPEKISSDMPDFFPWWEEPSYR